MIIVNMIHEDDDNDDGDGDGVVHAIRFVSLVVVNDDFNFTLLSHKTMGYTACTMALTKASQLNFEAEEVG